MTEPTDRRLPGPFLTRRRFLAGSVATAGVVGTLGAGCSNDQRGSRNGEGAAGEGTSSPTTAAARPDAAGVVVEDLPSDQQVFDWIADVVGQGIRRPGYPADAWAEDWIEAHFTEMGLEDVHREEVPVRRWEPGDSSLVVTTSSGATRELDHFPVPYAAPVEDLDVQLLAFDAASPAAVTGKASLHETELLTLPATAMGTLGSAPADLSRRIIDDDEGSLTDGTHTVPFPANFGATGRSGSRTGCGTCAGTTRPASDSRPRPRGTDC